MMKELTREQIRNGRKKVLDKGHRPTHIFMNEGEWEESDIGNEVDGMIVKPMSGNFIKRGTILIIDARLLAGELK